MSGGAEIHATLFVGEATRARYADLAEKYLTDQEYETGTVVMVGGEQEVTIVTGNDCYVLGVISANPAYLMNSSSKGQAVGLTGRLPVKIKGSVKKGQPIWPTENGHACSIDNGRHPFGFALENGQDGLVECLIK
jgi:hypothetical protein